MVCPFSTVTLFSGEVVLGTAAGAAHGSAHDPDHAYHFGLDRLIDGLAVLIDSHH